MVPSFQFPLCVFLVFVRGFFFFLSNAPLSAPSVQEYFYSVILVLLLK